MVRLVLIFVMLLCLTASAQSPKEYTLKLTPQQMDYIYNVLSERPFKEVSDLLATIRQQVIMQNEAKKD